MIVTRRQILRTAGGLLPALLLPAAPRAEKAVEIAMRGRSDGSHVWFDPVGMRLHPGQTVVWINLDPGNAHTATAYHPANFGRPRRIPERAAPWNSDYLLPNETFGVVLTQAGVYDFYCVPHEHAGMVGRIVVGAPDSRGRPGDQPAAGGEGALPEAAVNGFPSVDEIMRKGIVRRG